MIRTKNAVELCALIVDDVYGELASRIFAILLRRGRLTIPMLVAQSQLSPKHIAHGLAVLVRQGLAYAFEEGAGNTFYESNIEAAYSLIRIGKTLDIVELRYGEAARVFMQIVLALGHASVEDVAKEYEKRDLERVEREKAHAELQGEEEEEGDTEVPEGENGLPSETHVQDKDNSAAPLIIPDDWHKSGKMDEALWDLLEARLIEPVTRSMFTSPDDIYKTEEKILVDRDYGGSITGTKAKAEIKENIRSRLRDVRDSGREAPRRKSKRGRNGDYANGDSKRQKMGNGERTNGNLDAADQIDRNLIIRVNHEKCLVAQRSLYLTGLARHDIGNITAQIYAEFLRIAEKFIPRCRLDPTMDELETNGAERFIITTMELEQQMDKDIMVSKGIGSLPEEKPAVNGTGSSSIAGRKRAHDDRDGSDEEHNPQNSGHQQQEIFEDGTAVKSESASRVTFVQPEDRQSRLLNLNKHLGLLADHRHHFLTKCGNDGRGEWTIDFGGLADYMRQVELDTIIRQDFGTYGLRLCQILRQKGKLDESTLQNCALIQKKDIRTKLAEMQRVGFVDVQEVPRDASRAVNRMIFLWFVDKDRITAIVLDSIYKTMARCLEVLDVEKMNSNEVLLTTQRTDVQGYEEEMLDPRSLDQYRAWLEKQEKMLTQVSRLDDLVGVFRDY